VAQLYRRALGSLFVASYYSQGSGGGILTRLHTGLKLCELLPTLQGDSTRRVQLAPQIIVTKEVSLRILD
jgi:hypothetical protein